MAWPKSKDRVPVYGKGTPLRKAQDKMPSPTIGAKLGVKAGAKALKYVAPGVAAGMSAVKSIGGAVAKPFVDANREQNLALQGMKDRGTIRGLAGRGAIAGRDRVSALNRREAADRALPAASNAPGNNDSFELGPAPAAGPSRQRANKPTLYTNVKGGLRGGNTPGGIVDRSESMGRSRIGGSRVGGTTSNGLEVSNSSWTPEETAAFMRQPGRPGTRMRSGIGGPRQGETPFYGGHRMDSKSQTDWSRDTTPNFNALAAGFKGKAKQGRIASLKAQYGRERRKAADARDIEAMRQGGQNYRGITGNQNTLNNTALQGENSLAVKREDWRNKAAEQNARFGHDDMTAQRENRWDNEAAAQKNAWDTNADNSFRAWEGFKGGMSNADAQNIENSGEWGVDYGSVGGFPQKSMSMAKPHYVKPEFDAMDRQLPGTGVWVTPPGADNNNRPQSGTGDGGRMGQVDWEQYR